LSSLVRVLGTASSPRLATQAMGVGQRARVGTATALWAGLPFALGSVRLLRREVTWQVVATWRAGHQASSPGSQSSHGM